MRFAFCSAALLAGGFLLVSFTGASAESQGAEQKPSEQTEQKPPEQAKGEQKPADQATAEQQAEARIKQEIEEYREAARLSLSAGAAECVWTGRRITSLLWRDDVDTARRYLELYDRFGCSAEHLKIAFRCVIEQGPIDPKAADRLAQRVHACWIDPEGTTTAASRSTSGSAAKSGTIPN